MAWIEAWIATGSRDGKAKILDASTGKEQFVLDHGNSVVESVAFSPDGRTLAIGGQFGKAKILNALNGAQLADIQNNYYDVYGMNFSADGTKLAVTGMDQEVRIYDTSVRRATG